MKREELIGLLATAATARGYAFHTGEMHLAGGTVRIYPAAWLAPAAVRSHTGRREGETTFRVTLHLMAMPAGETSSSAGTSPESAATEPVWQRLEGDALGIASEIASSPAVCSVENVRCDPARQSLTVHGETSIALTLDVTMWYHL